MKEKIKFIKELAKSINSNQLDGIEYENENEKFKISLKKKRKEKTVVVGQANQVAPISTQQEHLNLESKGISQVKVEVAEEISGTKVMSPMVGTYYSKPSPTSDAFVKEGFPYSLVCLKLKEEGESLWLMIPIPKHAR